MGTFLRRNENVFNGFRDYNLFLIYINRPTVPAVYISKCGNIGVKMTTMSQVSLATLNMTIHAGHSMHNGQNFVLNEKGFFSTWRL